MLLLLMDLIIQEKQLSTLLFVEVYKFIRLMATHYIKVF